MMDYWSARDSIWEGSDSFGNEMSDCGAVGAVIFPGLLYVDSCSKCLSLTFVPCCMFVFHPVAFSDLWDCVLGSHIVSVKSCNS